MRAVAESMYVLHLAPFDPAGYPPLINTIRVCREWSIDSVVVASSPTRFPHLVGDAVLRTPQRHLARGALQSFLLLHGLGAIRRHGRPALVVAHNLLALAVASAVAATVQVPFVYHCHDFHEGQAWKDRPLLLVERLAGGRAAEIWVPAPERAAIAARRHMESVRVVRNYPALVGELPPRGRLRDWLKSQGSKNRGEGALVTRHGQIGAGHCVIELISALSRLPDTTELVVIGSGGEDYQRACLVHADEMGMRNRVFFHGFAPRNELFELLVDGDAASGLYALGSLNNDTPAPNKVYENLAMGVPVVVWDSGSLADDIRATDAGLAVPYGSIEGLSEAFRSLLYDEGEKKTKARRAAREAHLSGFNYQTQLAGTVLGSLRAKAAC